jgi:quercetin dioxygenase-like cupin family protein
MNASTLAHIGAPDVRIIHHFVGGLYAKETHIPAGRVLTQHQHAFDHLSVLALGRVRLCVNGGCREIEAPAFLTIEAGKAHEVTALTDVVWGCLHATDETDPAKVDAELIA